MACRRAAAETPGSPTRIGCWRHSTAGRCPRGRSPSGHTRRDGPRRGSRVGGSAESALESPPPRRSTRTIGHRSQVPSRPLRRDVDPRRPLGNPDPLNVELAGIRRVEAQANDLLRRVPEGPDAVDVELAVTLHVEQAVFIRRETAVLACECFGPIQFGDRRGRALHAEFHVLSRSRGDLEHRPEQDRIAANRSAVQHPSRTAPSAIRPPISHPRKSLVVSNRHSTRTLSSACTRDAEIRTIAHNPAQMPGGSFLDRIKSPLLPSHRSPRCVK